MKKFKMITVVMLGLVAFAGSAFAAETCDVWRDQCFNITKENGDSSGTRYTIICTKGSEAGKEKCIYYQNSSGKWSSFCGGWSMNENSMQEAGNKACR